MSNSSAETNPAALTKAHYPGRRTHIETGAYNDNFLQEDPRRHPDCRSSGWLTRSKPGLCRNGQNAAFFGGLVGGLAVGALAGGFGGGYGHGYGYGGGYYNSGYNDCYIDSQPRYNHWGDVVGYRRVRVCN